jgi:hypothetical protein
VSNWDDWKFNANKLVNIRATIKNHFDSEGHRLSKYIFKEQEESIEIKMDTAV